MLKFLQGRLYSSSFRPVFINDLSDLFDVALGETMNFYFGTSSEQAQCRKADHWRIYFNRSNIFVIQVFGITTEQPRDLNLDTVFF